jgi:hypothetical protein
MISVTAFNDSFAGALFSMGAESLKLSLLLDYAEPLGWQDFGEFGKVEIFRLRKAIPGHPVFSTVSRETLEKGIAAIHAAYGSTVIAEGKPADFAAVESGMSPTTKHTEYTKPGSV